MTGPIGVVIPLYNKEAFIRRAVESVLRQTCSDFRLVVVDDGSTDSSAQVVEGIGDPRVALVRATHRGPGAARNFGMRSIEADWIGLLDADDEWHPTFLERTRAIARRVPKIVAVFTGIRVRNTPARRSSGFEGLIEDYHGARLRHRVAMTSSSVLIRRSAFLSIGGFREGYRYAEDTDAWFRLTCAGPVHNISDALCEIETNVAGATTTAAGARERAEGLERLLDGYDVYRRTLQIPPWQARSCRRFMQHQRGRLAVHLFNAGCSAAGTRVLLTGVPFGPLTWREYVTCAGLALGRGRRQKHALQTTDR